MPGEDQGKPLGRPPGGVPDGSEWVTVAEAARRLGITPRAIRSRIKHHSLLSRPRGNQGQEVLVTDDMEAGEDPPGEALATVALMVQVTRLEERLAAAEAVAAGLRADVERRERDSAMVATDLRAERDRLAAELAEARKPALVRLLAGLLEAFRRR